MPALAPEHYRRGGANAAPVLARLADEFYAPITPLVTNLNEQGLSLREIAAELVRRGIEARHGRVQWSAAQVRRILHRAKRSNPKPTAAETNIYQHVEPFHLLRNAKDPALPGLKNAEDPSPALLTNVDTSGASPSLQITVSLGTRTVGPLTLDQVRALLADGTATPASLARVNGGPWQRLGAVIGSKTS